MTPIRGTTQVKDTYKGYKVGARHLQWIQGRYGITTRGMRHVQDTYKGKEVGTRHLQGV